MLPPPIPRLDDELHMELRCVAQRLMVDDWVVAEFVKDGSLNPFWVYSGRRRPGYKVVLRDEVERCRAQIPPNKNDMWWLLAENRRIALSDRRSFSLLQPSDLVPASFVWDRLGTTRAYKNTRLALEAGLLPAQQLFGIWMIRYEDACAYIRRVKKHGPFEFPSESRERRAVNQLVSLQMELEQRRIA